MVSRSQSSWVIGGCELTEVVSVVVVIVEVTKVSLVISNHSFALDEATFSADHISALNVWTQKLVERKQVIKSWLCSFILGLNYLRVIRIIKRVLRLITNFFSDEEFKNN